MDNTRKRPFGENYNNNEAKRGNYGTEPTLKLLVPGYVAGALIGKAGCLLNELKQLHGGNIRISAPKEFYPGTNERVVVLTGSEDQINSLNRHIMEKTENPSRDETMRHVSVDQERAKKVKIVLTNNAAGLLIGKAGATIKGIQTETNAWLSVAPTGEGMFPGERLLSVTSENQDQRYEACQRVVAMVARDASTMSNTQLKYPGGADAQLSNMLNSTSTMNKNSIGADRGGASEMKQLVESIVEKLSGAIQGGPRPIPSSAPPPSRRLRPKVEVTLDVPQVMVGGILGKQGNIISEMQQRSGARLTFTDSFRNEEGITNRKLSITGNMDQAYKAFQFVNKQVVGLENEQKQSQQQQQQQQQQFGGGGPSWMQQQQQQQQQYNDPYQQNFDNVPYQAWGQSPSY